jgi:hypothetical protein
MKYVGLIACIGETRNNYIILVGRSQGKKTLRDGREDNIKMDLTGIEFQYVN